jgi:hypothetical protein
LMGAKTNREGVFTTTTQCFYCDHTELLSLDREKLKILAANSKTTRDSCSSKSSYQTCTCFWQFFIVWGIHPCTNLTATNILRVFLTDKSGGRRRRRREGVHLLLLFILAFKGRELCQKRGAVVVVVGMLTVSLTSKVLFAFCFFVFVFNLWQFFLCRYYDDDAR